MTCARCGHNRSVHRYEQGLHGWDTSCKHEEYQGPERVKCGCPEYTESTTETRMRDAYYADDTVTLYHGDCLDVLAELPDNSVDAVVTDPPYGLEFMGKDWDRFAGNVSDRDFKGFVLSQQRTRNVKCPDCNKWAYDHPGRACECGGIRRAQGGTFQQWCERWSTECLRVLKPGGHLLAFGGSRTWHRLAAAIEDSGFEIRDSIAWLYGSGFPKSLDVSKAIDKAAGVERERIPRIGGALNAGTANGWTGSSPDSPTAPLAGSQQVDTPATDAAAKWQGWGTAMKPAFEPIVVARKPLTGTVAANVQEHGTGALNIDACRIALVDEKPPTGSGGPNTSNSMAGGIMHGIGGNVTPSGGRWPTNVLLDAGAAAELDAQSGVQKSGTAVQRNGKGQSLFGGIGAGSNADQALNRPDAGFGDSGGASRFFPAFRYEAKAPASERPSVDGVAHPTVKPLDLMRWLVRLVTPPGGLVLDPFAGSGTTAEACVHEHMRCTTIEREADYLPLIVARLTKPIEVGFDFELGTA